MSNISFINTWMRQDIKNLQSYTIPPNSTKIKLDAMESPFVLESNLQQELTTKLQTVALNRYPQSQDKLKQVVKNLMDIPDNLEILLGNGSDELIQLLMLACSDNDNILGFNPSFVMYEMIAKWCRLNYISVNLTSNFDIDIDKTLEEIEVKKPKIVFIAYPNNPTGNNFSRKSIEAIIKCSNGLVVIDEAYYAYSDDSFVSDIDKFNNLVVLRTISKIGFAGLRLGVMIGAKTSIQEFDKLRMPYNINSLTMKSAEFLLTKKEIILKNAAFIISQRSIVFDFLNNFKQITAFKSDANFILFKVDNSQQLFDFLSKNNILVKHLPQLSCLRVNVSSASENQEFFNILTNFYE